MFNFIMNNEKKGGWVKRKRRLGNNKNILRRRGK
jgi:hypothetical protein